MSERRERADEHRATNPVADQQAGDEQALRDDVGAVVVARDALAATGPDTVSFLQGQLSQDLEAQAVGATAWSLVLSPQGKVDALVRLTRRAYDEIVVDVDTGHGDDLRARLERFKLRVRCEIEPVPWGAVALRGPRSGAVAAALDPSVRQAPAGWAGIEAIDLVGPDVEVPDGVRACGPAAYEVLRIEAGWPLMGAELTERTIPAEAGIVDRTVSFTKGCFTGQELVARIDSRGGNVPRRLRALVLPGAELPPAGAEVHLRGEADGKAIGAVTSSAHSATRRAAVAAAYLRRDTELPADVQVSWDGGTVDGRAAAVPLDA
ncbi:folate-binding protein YgfZ [soil metagenome]